MSYTIVYRCESTLDPLVGPDRETAKNWCNLPNPQSDGIEKFEMEVDVCGTQSKKLFKLWWHVGREAKARLSQDKYLILKVPSDKVKRGEHQVTFPRREAEIIGELCPVTLKSIMY